MLAGYGLAKTAQEMLPVTITLGLAGALETLVSQSYGQKKYLKCAHYLNKQYILITILFIPLSMILYNIEPILTAFGQDQLASEFA